jgi:DNA-binding protein HU-beta
MAKKKVEVVKEVVEKVVISKNNLIDMVAEESEYQKSSIKDISTEVFNKIGSLLAEGNSVAIFGFGTFTVKDTEARTGRNPRTGEAIAIAAGKRISFKPSSVVKNAVKDAA